VKRAEEMVFTEQEQIVRVNLTGTFLFGRAVGKVMIR